MTNRHRHGENLRLAFSVPGRLALPPGGEGDPTAPGGERR
jgi:hypothetical protein